MTIPTPSVSHRPPHIIVFQTDDHGQWASSPYGLDLVHTPSMQWLADTGVTFTHAATPCPVCSPARASFWTGQLPSRHGVHDYMLERHDRRIDHPGVLHQPTLATRLKEAGYRVGLIGKWHGGGGGQVIPPGFDTWFTSRMGTNARFGPQHFNHNGSDVKWHGQQAPRITKVACESLQSHAQDHPEAPLLLYVGYTDTHSPFAGAPERLASHYRKANLARIPSESFSPAHTFTHHPVESPQLEREKLAQYLAAVSMIDEQMGRVLDELANLDMLDNAMIVYTADHGHNCGHHGIWCKGNATVPQNFLDETIRIPMIIRAPDATAGTRRHEPVDLCDLHATLLHAAGLEPQTPAGPGQPLQPLLSASPAAPPAWRDFQCCEYGNARMIRTSRYKLIKRYPSAKSGPLRDELYDLINDPRERENVIDQPAHAACLAPLYAQLDDYFDQHEDPAQSGSRIDLIRTHNQSQPWSENGEALAKSSPHH